MISVVAVINAQTTRLRRSVPTKILAAILTTACFAAAALVLAHAAYAWSSVKYVDAESVPAGFARSTSGQADRLFNHIWRPTPIYFCSHYPPYLVSYVCSLWDNPILDERDAFFSYAHCLNNDSVTSYPTTCVTTRP